MKKKTSVGAKGERRRGGGGWWEPERRPRKPSNSSCAFAHMAPQTLCQLSCRNQPRSFALTVFMSISLLGLSERKD